MIGDKYGQEMDRGRQDDQPDRGSTVSPAGAVSGSGRLTFWGAVAMAEAQVDYANLTVKANLPIGRDLCRVMAEVYLMNPRAIVRIGREDLEAGLVQEVYRALDQEAFELACESVRRLAGHIRSPKAYMRTLLYNQVFEVESAWQRKVEAWERGQHG